MTICDDEWKSWGISGEVYGKYYRLQIVLNVVNVIWGWRVSLIIEVEWWQQFLFSQTSVKISNLSVKYTVVMWPNWWSHHLSTFVKVNYWGTFQLCIMLKSWDLDRGLDLGTQLEVYWEPEWTTPNTDTSYPVTLLTFILPSFPLPYFQNIPKCKLWYASFRPLDFLSSHAPW